MIDMRSDSYATSNSTNKVKAKPRTVSHGTILGRQEITIYSRKNSNLPNSFTMQKPKVDLGQLYEDRTFPLHVERGRWSRNSPSWKRPKDYVADSAGIRLFGDKVNRYCVRQGQIGDCFFMTALSAIAEHPKQLRQIMPTNAYRTNGRRYRGIFHCRFWLMGEWIDVYTDDRVPYNDDVNGVFGGHSKEKNVVWVTLMEKALAKLCKGYASIGGDQAAAYVLLTGGLVDKVDVTNDQTENDNLFKRIRQSIKCRSVVLTGIDENEVTNVLLQGLVANHAYEITAATTVKHSKTKDYLLRIRNPWGETNKLRPPNENGDWKGRWSYDSTEWNAIGRRLRDKLNVKYEADGEFWICMQDFHCIFGHVYFADTIPNFDESGFRKKDKLNRVITILGEWSGETTAGNDIKTKFKNPCYLLTVPSRAPSRDNQTPVVFQLIQQHQNAVSQSKETLELLFCRLDIFRIEKEKKTTDKRLQLSLTELTEPESYVATRFIPYRYRLAPGKYLMVPNFLKQNQHLAVSRTFCIRIFSGTSLKCRQVTKDVVAMVGKPFIPRQNPSPTDALYSLNVIGEWSGEAAAGSDDVRRMKNPKFILTIQGFLMREQNVCFQLRHCRDMHQNLHCRLDVFKQITESIGRNKQKWLLLHQITNSETFVGGNEVPYEYKLMPGKYLLLPNCSRKENLACAFSIRILSSAAIKCRHLKEQPIVFVQKASNILKHESRQYELEKIAFLFGEWIKDKTAGGQISNESFSRNPQYELTVSGTVPQPVLVDLLQEAIEPIHAIGYHIIQVESSQRIPVNRETLLKLEMKKMKTVLDRMHSMCISCESSDYYMLPPGRYIVLVYANEPTNEKKFTLLLRSQKKSNIKLSQP